MTCPISFSLTILTGGTLLGAIGGAAMMADAAANWMPLAVLVVNGIMALAMPFVYFMIRRLEKNTNSIKDALVASTKAVAHAEGKLEGKAEEKAEVAIKAEGAKEAEAVKTTGK